MIWMTWRQFRVQAIAALGALVLLTVYLLLLGHQIRSSYTGDLAGCHSSGDCATILNQLKSQYQERIYFLGGLLVAVPGIIGIFWGAPTITRELETGTYRLVWNQSVTRQHWLIVKLTLLGLISMAVVGLFSLLLTWAASPFDVVAANRFSALLFGTRNIVPVAYAAFAFVLGLILGLTVRRTVPAMALTLVVFVVTQIVMPTLVRPHLETPVTLSQTMSATTIANLSFLGEHPTIKGLTLPDAWVTSTSELLTAAGTPIDQASYGTCTAGSFESAATCLGQLNLHVNVQYQPADRYWRFQWSESAIFMVLAGLLAAFGIWRLRESIL